MKKLLVLAGVSALLVSGCAGSDYPRWNCGDQITLTAGDTEFNADDVPLPITYTATVTIGGMEAPALFRMEGVNQVWYFGDEFMGQLIGPKLMDDYLEKHNQQSISGNHKIIITPNGVSGYYDFTDTEPGDSVSVNPRTVPCERE